MIKYLNNPLTINYMFPKLFGLPVKTATHRDQEQLSRVFSALGESGRLRIFTMLAYSEGMCVTEIAYALNSSLPAVSYHLKILEIAGLVKKERMGQEICYEIKKNKPLVRRIVRIIQST